MKFEKKFITKYLDTIIELSDETGMSKQEVRTMLDITLSYQNPEFINFDEIKTEIKTFLTINIFSLICKSVSYTHLRAHETVLDLVCRLLLEKKKNN